MKKILLFASALAGLFLASSCQQENLEPQQMAGTVKFTVEAPGAIATKTIADGQNVDVVHYAVYKTNSDETHAIEVPSERPLAQGFVPMSGKKANIDFNLLQDQKYTVIFWAQVSQDDVTGQNDYYELGDLRAISMKKDAENNIVGNEEARAAFFAWYSFETYEHKDHVVTLKRPFAQLNLLTTLESLTPSQTGQTTGYTIDIEKSTVTVEGLTSTFYPYAQPVLEGTQGKAEETNETFTFTLEDTPAVQGIGEGQDGDLLKVNGNAYHYVSMNYFFVPVDEYTVNLTYGIKTNKGSIENTVVSVPVKKNFRTNVIGNLLTKESKFEIIVDERFEGDNNLKLWDGKEVKEPAYDATTYYITEPAELAWFAQAVNGGNKFAGKTVKLMNDIYLDNSMWTPIGATGKFEGTFDGQENTIFDLNVTTEGKASAGLFANAKYVRNLTVVNAKVTGHYKTGVIVADGLCARIDNCHAENAVVVSTPFNNNDANHVGGIVGYLSAENEAYVTNSSVKNSTISGFRDVAGIAGTANQASVVTDNTVENVTVIADQSYDYVELKAANVGLVAGRIHAKALVQNNEAIASTTIVRVKTAENLEYQVKNSPHSQVNIELGADIAGDAMIQQKADVNVVIDGKEYKYDGTIKIHNGSNYNNAELLIKNVKFETATAALNFIMPNEFGVENGVTRRYSNNVTVDNCTFTATGAALNTAVGVQAKSTKNLQVLNCTATGMHSLLQAQSCGADVIVKGATINGKNGVAFKQVQNAVVEGSTITAAAYGIRFDGNTDNYAVTLKDNEVTAVQPFIVRKMTGKANVINVEDSNVFNANGAYDVVITKDSDDEAYSYPSGTYTLTCPEGLNVYPVDNATSFKAAVANEKLAEVNLQGDVDYVGYGFEVERDVVLNMNGHEFNAGSTASSYWYALEAYGEHNVVINDANMTRAGVFAGEGADVVFNSGKINHKPERTSRYIFCAKSGSTITIIDGTFTNDRAKNSFFWADDAVIYVEGGNFGGVASNNKIVTSNGGQVIIKGGTFNFDPTAWVAEGYSATKTGSTWTVSNN